MAPDIRPIRKRRVYEDVFLQLQKLIDERRLQPGERLPPERELASRFGVNRTSLRQALNALSLLRLVDIRPGDGVYVRDSQAEGSLEAVILKQLLAEEVDPALVLEALEARQVLEVHLVGLAAENATNEDVSALEGMIRRMGEAYEKGDPSYIQLEWEFHLRLVRMSGRRLLPRLLNSFYSLIQSAYPVLAELGKSSFSVEEHRAILRAVNRHDARAARKALEGHLLSARRAWEGQSHQRSAIQPNGGKQKGGAG